MKRKIVTIMSYLMMIIIFSQSMLTFHVSADPSDEIFLLAENNYIVVGHSNLYFKFFIGTAGYNEIWLDGYQWGSGTQLVANEQMVLQYQQNPNNWKQRGNPISVQVIESSPTHVKISRSYTDYAGTNFNIIYDFFAGCRTKILFKGNIGTADTYRVVWKYSGINKQYMELDEEKNIVRVYNSDNDSYTFDYSDVTYNFGNITQPELEQKAYDHKLNMYFNLGQLPVGNFILDPSFGEEDAEAPFFFDIKDFDEILFHPFYGFTNNESGDVCFIPTYTNISARNIDNCNITFNNSNFLFSIVISDELERDFMGNIIEEEEGYLYLKRDFVENFIDDIYTIATMSAKYEMVSYQGADWLRIYIPDINGEYAWKAFDEPKMGETWFSWGCNQSVYFNDRAMFITQTADEYGVKAVFNFSHPTNNNGQIIYFNKAYVNDTLGIKNPIFEYGMPRFRADYKEQMINNNTFYVIEPAHFSQIGIHEAASGEVDGGVFWKYDGTDDNRYEAKIWHGNKDDSTPNPAAGEGVSTISGSYLYQTFNTGDLIDIITAMTITLRFWYDYESAYIALRNGNHPSYSAPADVGDSGGRFHGYQNYGDFKWAGVGASSYDPFGPCFVDRNTNYAIRIGAVDEYITVGYGAYAGGYPDGYAYYSYSDEYLSADLWFIIYGFNKQFNVTRSSGGGTETNTVSFTSDYYYTDNSGVLLMRIPVSNKVKGIIRVYNTTSGGDFTSVDSYSSISVGTYYYDESSNFVYLGINNVHAGNTLTYQVNCSFDSKFEIVPPSYLRSGEHFSCHGVITDGDGIPISGYLATTSLIGFDYETDDYYNIETVENFTSSEGWELSNAVISDGKLHQNTESYYMWYNGSVLYDYRKLLNLTGNLKDYQVKLVVGNSSGGDVNCSGYVQPDFDDVIFISYKDNTTFLPFHKWNYTEDGQATFWINNTNNDSRIWMYYGNEYAIDQSAPYDTWLFWDPFDTKWELGDSSSWAAEGYYNKNPGYYHDIAWTIADGKISHGNLNNVFELTGIVWAYEKLSNIAVETRGKTNSDDKIGIFARSAALGGSDTWVLVGFFDRGEPDRTEIGRVGHYWSSPSYGVFQSNASVGTISNDYHTIEMKVYGPYNSMAIKLDLDGINTITDVDRNMGYSNTNPGYIGLYSGYNKDGASFEYLRVRNYTLNEPSWGNMTDEEALMHPEPENCTLTRRKPIYVNTTENSTSVFTEKFTINYEAEMNSNFSDLRFVDMNGRLLDYYIESKTDGSQAIVTVEFRGAAEGNNIAAFMYYGNGSEESLSNRDSVYIDWFDFEDGTMQGFSEEWSYFTVGNFFAHNGLYGVRVGGSSQSRGSKYINLYGYEKINLEYYAEAYSMDTASEYGYLSVTSGSDKTHSAIKTHTDYIYPDYFINRQYFIEKTWLGPNFDAKILYGIVGSSTGGYGDYLYVDDIRLRPCLMSGTSSSIGLAEGQNFGTTGYAQRVYSYDNYVKYVNVTAITENTTNGTIDYYVSEDGMLWEEVTLASSVEFITEVSVVYVKIVIETTNTSSICPYVDGLNLSVNIERYKTPGHIIIQSKWNCTSGNYECDMSTTSVYPGYYDWEILFTDIVSGITFKEGGPVFIEYPVGGGGDGGEGPYYAAHLYYSFFDLNTGTGLSDDYFKFYIGPDKYFNEGDRIKGGMRPTYLGQTLYYKITDYFDNKIYPLESDWASILIQETETYIDCGVNLRQFRAKNMNSSTVYFVLEDADTSQQLGRWIPPYEETELFLLDGYYDITVQYYNIYAELESSIFIGDFPVYSDTFYLIPGYSIADIVIQINNVNTSILDQLINVGVFVNNFNSTIFQQELNMNLLLQNIQSDITQQHINTRLAINNTNANINEQIASVYLLLNNTNTSIWNQTVLIRQDIESYYSTIENQMIGILQNMTFTNSTVTNQANLMAQIITFLDTNITQQMNNVWQTVNYTNSSINTSMTTISQNVSSINSILETQLNYIIQNITNENCTILSQMNTIIQNVENLNGTIDTQLTLVRTEIMNLNNTINFSTNSVSQNITSFRSNITTQVNSIWMSVNNTNDSINYQTNIITAIIDNLNTDIETQLSYVSTYINNTNSNITDQLIDLDFKINNTADDIVDQITKVNISIQNLNGTHIHEQLNAIITNITSYNLSVVNQSNLIMTIIGFTESNITNQLNAVNTTIGLLRSNVTDQVNIVLDFINVTNSYIHTQGNVLTATITLAESNLTEQFNYVEVWIENVNDTIKDQINSINTTIKNFNDTIDFQLNAIRTIIENSNLSMVEQMNLIYTIMNNTNSTIWTQVNGVNTKITHMWSNINYSFTAIDSAIFYYNTTIVNLIEDLNATLLAQLTMVLDNVSQSGESVFSRVMTVLANLSKLNTSLHDQIISRSLAVIDSVTENMSGMYDITLNILDKVTAINMSVNGSSILEILNLTRNLQVQLISNFSYINTRVNNLSGIIQFNMNRVMNALREVNVTGYNELMYALLDILQSLKLPHEWQLPNINYTIDDTLPPISTISATSAITGGISVRWVSSDNWGVAYATICYRLDNASWKVWKPATVAAGTDVFDIDDVTLINGTVVWFRCLGTDIAGNIESETDRNVCSITYSEASTITQPIGGAMQMITDSTFYSIYFWIIIGLLVIILVSIYIYRDSVTKKKLKMEMKSRPRNPIFYEEEL